MGKPLDQILIIVLALQFTACGGAKKQDVTFVTEPPFEISEVYTREWLGGTPDAGKGYEFTLKLKGEQSLVEPDSVYYRGLRAKLNPMADGNTFKAALSNKKNRDWIMHEDTTLEAGNRPPERLPFDLEKNQAVVSYRYNGSRYYLLIDRVQEKELQAFPQGGNNVEN